MVMPSNTILFIDRKKKSIAFDWEFFKNNSEKYNQIVVDPIETYFKADNGQWIDFSRATKTQDGSLDERIAKASVNEAYFINEMNIPECFYYASNGNRYNIPIHNGATPDSNWYKRVHIETSDANIQFTDLYNFNLIIELSKDYDNLNDAFLYIDGMFYNFSLINTRTLYVIGVRQNLTPLSSDHADIEVSSIPAEQLSDLVFGRKFYDMKIDLYLWDGLSKESYLKPFNIRDEFIVMASEVKEAGFVFYNNLLYPYKINPINPRELFIPGMTTTNMQAFNIKDTLIYYLSDSGNEVGCYIESGKTSDNREVEFDTPIYNSLVLLGNFLHEYYIYEDNLITYPDSRLGLASFDVNSLIQSIHFYKK